MPELSEIGGVGPTCARVLADGGVKGTGGLPERAGSAAGRRELARATGLTTTQILEWVNRADLQVNGVGEEYSDLLESAGVDTVKELATRRADNLHTALLEVDTEKKLFGALAAQSMVEGWAADAQTLEPAVTS